MLWEKRIRRSFLISLVIHGIIAFVFGLYLLGVTEHIKEAVVELAFFEPKTPKPRQLQPPKQPDVPPKQLTFEETPTFSKQRYIQASPKSRPIDISKSLSRPDYVIKFTPQRIQETENPSNLTNLPFQDASASAKPTVDSVTLPETTSTRGDSPKGLGLLKRGAQSDGRGSKRGLGGSGGGINREELKIRTRLGLTMTETTNAADLEAALKDFVEEISLQSERQLVSPLPKGEPGGRVIGKGKEIAGVFRFVRLKHPFSDWWDDPTSIAGIANWLNEHTQIRTDLNVEGGPVTFTDANLMKSPLVIMTGHDPALIRQRGTGGMPTPGFRRKLTTSEKIALRKYLIDRGGMLFSDDCGHNSVNYPFTRIVVSVLRSVLPEYPVRRIPNDHEIYNCYYRLGGPPQGANIFWIHGPRGPTPKQLKGIFIDERIAVLLSQRDYLCAAETVNVHSGKINRQFPVYRFLVNVVVYALTHGGISDYSNYVPVQDDTVKLPKRPPSAVPKATPRSK